MILMRFISLLLLLGFVALPAIDCYFSCPHLRPDIEAGTAPEFQHMQYRIPRMCGFKPDRPSADGAAFTGQFAARAAARAEEVNVRAPFAEVNAACVISSNSPFAPRARG
jgi:hypothetical protein